MFRRSEMETRLGQMTFHTALTVQLWSNTTGGPVIGQFAPVHETNTSDWLALKLMYSKEDESCL